MSTLYFASHEITIYRARPHGSNKYTYSATFTAYPADIQPASPERIESISGRIGKVWVAYVDPLTPVKEGDIVVASGTRYGVRSVSTWQGAGLLDHRELTLESKDNA